MITSLFKSYQLWIQLAFPCQQKRRRDAKENSLCVPLHFMTVEAFNSASWRHFNVNATQLSQGGGKPIFAKENVFQGLFLNSTWKRAVFLTKVSSRLAALAYRVLL